MTKQPTKKAKEAAVKIDSRVLASLIISLVVISVFPFYLAFYLWPDPSAILIDCVYLLILAGFVSVFTGRYRPKWLIVSLISLGTLNLIGLLWLYTILSRLNPTL